MNRFIHTMALALSLTGATIVAADKPSRDEALARLEEISAQLALSDEQKAQITPILTAQIADLRALQDNSALKPRHKIKRAREISEVASGQIRALLTPEQQVTYDEIRAEGKAKMREQFRERRKGRESSEAAGG